MCEYTFVGLLLRVAPFHHASFSFGVHWLGYKCYELRLRLCFYYLNRYSIMKWFPRDSCLTIFVCPVGPTWLCGAGSSGVHFTPTGLRTILSRPNQPPKWNRNRNPSRTIVEAHRKRTVSDMCLPFEGWGASPLLPTDQGLYLSRTGETFGTLLV